MQWGDSKFRNSFKTIISQFIIMKTLLYILLFSIGASSFAQITYIPDSLFEQALIDLGIDSDGTINGQVLTSDIESVIVLDLDHRGIQDLTGLEDFAALEILDVDGSQLTSLDVSNNIQLKELYCSSDSAGFNMMIASLYLSNNVNLELLYGENLIFLESLNVKNNNNTILTVNLPCFFEGELCELPELNCVMVDDEVAATKKEAPYSRWFIAADYYYSEDCTLGVNSLAQQQFSMHPNPAKNELFLNSNGKTGNLNIKIFSIEGRLLSTQNLKFERQASLDVSTLSKGVYFLNIEEENGNTSIKKFIKK